VEVEVYSLLRTLKYLAAGYLFQPGFFIPQLAVVLQIGYFSKRIPSVD
jgi:hypothetical protein